MFQSRTGSNGKLVLFLLGGLLLLAVVFSLVERVVPRNAGAATTAVPGEQPPTVRPELSRVDERTILVDAGFFHHSRFRFHGDEATKEADALFACLKAGIEREFGPEDSPTAPIEGIDRGAQRREMRALMKKIQERCMEEGMRLPGAVNRLQAPTPP